MFTGIVERVSNVKKIEKTIEGNFVYIEKPKNWKIVLGESISVNGVCSTVEKLFPKQFRVMYMNETLKITNIGNLKLKDKVNLEQSLRVGDRVSGHFVYGHIDTTCVINQITNNKSQKVIKIKIPKRFKKYFVYKGSVAINGVSLTISKLGKDFFEVSLIPHTIKNTGLGLMLKGDEVNIEVDIIAKLTRQNL